MNTMCFVPFAWGTELDIFWVWKALDQCAPSSHAGQSQKRLVQSCQAEAVATFQEQTEFKQGTGSESMWFFAQVGKKRVMLTGCKFRIQNSSQLCEWLKATENLEPEQIKRQVYRCDRVFWLTLLLADPQERLDYKKVWKAGALQLMLGVWNCSRVLPRKSAMAVQKRVDRFFNMSGIMRTHNFTVRVPSLSDHAVSKTKKL